MPTSATAALYVVALLTALAAAPEPRPTEPVRWPVATAAALLVVGIPTLAQLTVAPELLGDLGRDWSAIGRGQVWRLVTSLVVQDGGPGGAASNLAFLAVVGAAAERCWPRRQWVALALGAGVGAQLWGRVVQPVGAGNSVAVFGLAASLAVLGLRGAPGVRRVAGAVSLVAAAVLLATGDLHGGAAAIGAALATFLSSRRRSGLDPALTSSRRAERRLRDPHRR